jgi:shikimate dehydrogenase
MPDRYAVIGNPVNHSKSPQIHAAFARACSDSLNFSRVLAPLDGFGTAVAEFRASGGKGLSVTLPFKLEALALANRVAERARRAGAANFLRFDGADIFADNTDGAGLVCDLGQNLGIDLRGARVLIAGAGGAARGVILPLLEAGPHALCIVNRSADKAQALALEFADGSGGPAPIGGGYASVAGLQFDVVINATSASIAGELPQLPEGVFAPGSLAYDLMYADTDTPFMRFASQYGAARVADGLGMLVEQAAESFYLWRGVRPQTADVLRALRQSA